MANIPVARSYNQILGQMINAYLAKQQIPSIPVGDPILSFLEASAQSDLRNSQDVFQFLSSIALARANGLALDRIGADENAPRLPESAASGFVTIGDSSFVKKASTIYQGKSAPIVGSSQVHVVDALTWPASGSIYIGRGTNSFEGPLAYTSITNNTGYFTIQLAGGNNTQKFHNLGDPVVLAQGGNRSITAGQIVQTPQGNAGTAVQFSVLYNAVIPDGEVEITNVNVVSRTPGVIGNVASGAINSFVSNPFTGATVINPTPFSNGFAVEDDDTYRDRIRDIRQSRSKATALALKTGVTGATSADENKRIISASVVSRQGYPSTLYIDDGSGYEETSEGIAYEVIVDSAVGGEQYFSLANGRPVTKAFAKTAFQPPYSLEPGSKLSVKVGGVVYEHVFNAGDFLSIANATAYEVVASINDNPAIKFNASTADNGNSVVIFADDDINEDVEVIAPTVGFVDSNEVLGFPTGKVDTLRLYKNDILLNKDGTLASCVSNIQANWATMASGETIQISVDGVSIAGISDTYTITDADFVNAGTVYTSVNSNNNLESWAQVLNYKIPGITASIGAGFLILTSNAGRSSRAKISITGGSLVTSKNMFVAQTVSGTNKDYTFNRNLGLIRLEDSLVLTEGDRLTAGSLATRAFIQSSDLSIVTIGSGGAELWFCVDGNATLVKTGIQIGTSVAYSTTSTSYGYRVRATFGSPVFLNSKIGDWIIINDSIATGEKGAFRIVKLDSSFTWAEYERNSSYVSSGTVTLVDGGFKVVRSSEEPQRIIVPAGNTYTALTFAQSINSQLIGATASVYRTTKIRVTTNTFELNGNLALVVVDREGEKLSLPVSSAVTNLSSHQAAVQSGNDQAGTPSFNTQSVTAVTSTSEVTESNTSTLTSGQLIVATKPPDDGTGRISNLDHVSSIEVLGATVKMRNPVLASWLVGDRTYHARPYGLTAEDDFAVLVDQNVLNKRYSFNTYRKVKSSSNSYSITPTLVDVDNSNSSLALGFGTGFDWKDFAVWMKARAKSHLDGSNLNTTSTILWRYSRWGSEGNLARLQYRYPAAPATALSIGVDAISQSNVNVKVFLPSGAARTGYTIRTGTRIGAAVKSVSSGLYTYVFVLSFDIATASRTSNVTTITLTLPSGVSDHGIAIGNQIYVQSTSGSFTSGTKIVTAVGATTISYAETGANAGPIAGIGSASFDNAGEATLSGSTVVVGDVFATNLSTGLASPFADNSMKISSIAGDSRSFEVTSDRSGSISTTLGWGLVNTLSNISFFPVNSATATANAIVASVNALSVSPVSAKAIGGGTGTILDASYETAALGGTDPWYYFVDGVNYVRSTNTPALPANNFVFTFKDSISSVLAADDSDWVNEDVRLAPTTAKNVADFFKSTAVSGLSSSAEIIVSKNGQRPQIASLTTGSEGSVQVQSGSANSLTSSVVTSGILVSGGYSSAGFLTSDLRGLTGGMWVALDNANLTQKVGRITGSTALSAVDSNANFTFSGTTAWDYATTSPGLISVSCEIIKQGEFVQVRLLSGSLAGVEEGDVVIFKTVSPGSTANDGTFPVVRVEGTNTFWIENSNAVEEIITTAHMVFLTYNSILPGDKFSINTTVWGVNNIGDRTVTSIDLPSSSPALAPFNGTGSQSKFSTDGVTTTGTGAALGSNSPLVQVIEGVPVRLIKQILTISQNLTNTLLSDVKFTSNYGYDKVSTGGGTVLSALDKLQFSTDVASGIDGYRHSTGLIEEANKILYGVESDTSTYPGLVAEGSYVNINGPLIKRIRVSLSLRLNTGVAVSDVVSRVKSEVAAVINRTKVGVPVAIGNLVKAAQEVNGVSAAAILSPTYDASNDLISVQPFEKPLVLNVDEDIDISLVGE